MDIMWTSQNLSSFRFPWCNTKCSYAQF